jgi:addiction module HigA family antidote
MKRRIFPISPREMLVEEFLNPLGLSKYRLAKLIDVPATRIGDIVAGKRAITADTDLRLCRLFGMAGGLGCRRAMTRRLPGGHWRRNWIRSYR